MTPPGTPAVPWLGHGVPTNCSRIAPNAVIHWWPAGARTGDPCLCGEDALGGLAAKLCDPGAALRTEDQA